VTRIFRFAIAILALIAGVAFASAAPLPKTVAPLPKPAAGHPALDFSMPAAMIELKSALSPYQAPAAHENDGSRWYLLTASNQSVRPVARILMATDPANAALRFFPPHSRPEIWQVASSDSGVTVERVRAVSHHAYEVTLPPATQVSLALRVAYGDEVPSIQAWTVPALVAHNRQLAIFLAAVAGLIAAAFAIMAGVAVVTAHPAPGWTAVVLFLVLLARLQGAGVLDVGWVTAVGGPYGLSAMLSGLALAAALYLTDVVAPVVDLWPAVERRRRWVFVVVIAVSLLAFVGAPGAIVATQIVVLVGTAAIASYLVHRGLQGSKAARVVAPSAAIFALVAAITALIELGAFGNNPMASGIVAGFMAAGAVLLALAIAAGEGIAILPIARRHIPAEGAASVPVAATESEKTPEPVSLSVPEVVAAIGAAHQGVFDLDFASNRLKLSREAAALLGLPAARNFGHEDWLARIHPDDREIYASALEDYRAHPGLSFRIEFRARAESGRYPWFELRATIKRREDGTHCLGLMADITTRKELELATHDRSLQDPLTGLGNRVALLQELENVGAGWADVAVLFLDIDRFKSIHASLGDTGGDQMLLGLASRLTKQSERTGRAFRTGGDSFAIVVPGGAASVQKSAGALLDLCHAPYSIAGRSVFASATIGAATGREADDPLELIRNAELALGLAKRQGGGCAKLFTRDLESETRGDAVALETDLRRGLSQNEFAVYYQPIVRLTDGTVAGFEALLRWHHPQKGLVSPAEFIAHCEETGLIVALGRLALERTASELADWQRYFPLSPPLFASVNVSRRQLLDENLESSLKRLFTAGKFAVGSLKLEITESAVETGADAKSVLERLRGMGAVLAIDDFGTGMSSLSQLKDLPFETVKIDQSFLARRGAGKDDKDGSVVITSMVSLAHELKRDVVAEGVESEEDAEWLRDIGCDYAQGFFFSHPMPGDEVLKFIAGHFRADEPEAEDSATSGAAGVG
jgi:diguanylate cyclase (GGDEF)-like protein/PAS domain S-box-containing protein